MPHEPEPPAAEPGERPRPITPDMLAKPAGPQERRIEFERGMSYLPPLSLLLIVTYVAVLAWELSAGVLESRESLIAAGALYRPPVRDGELWRLLTATFLHGSPGHLIGNCVGLYIMGMACEHAFGFARSAAIYLMSGLGGSVLSVLVQPGPSVGASGVVFGVMGAVIVFLYQHQDAFYVRDKRIAVVLLVWAGFAVLTGLATPFVDNVAHIGGFLGGALGARAVEPMLLQKADEGRGGTTGA